MKSMKMTGIALATAAAGLFTVATVSTAYAADAAAPAKVMCKNSSACKGQGACKTKANACKGQNACKGKGMTEQDSKADCKAAQKAAKAA